MKQVKNREECDGALSCRKIKMKTIMGYKEKKYEEKIAKKNGKGKSYEGQKEHGKSVKFAYNVQNNIEGKVIKIQEQKYKQNNEKKK